MPDAASATRTSPGPGPSTSTSASDAPLSGPSTTTARVTRPTSDLATRAVERRAPLPLDTLDDVTATLTRLPLPPVDLVLGLGLADVAVQIAILLVRQR